MPDPDDAVAVPPSVPCTVIVPEHLRPKEIPLHPAPRARVEPVERQTPPAARPLRPAPPERVVTPAADGSMNPNDTVAGEG